MNILFQQVKAVLALAFSFIALVFSNSANALAPEAGWWWNAAESGRGFSIEVQDNTVFMSGFLYDAAGAPLWFVASGPYNHVTNRFEGDMLSLRGGQCITCTFRPPVIQPSLGRIQLAFSTTSTGTLTWPGGIIPITRQIYGVSEGIERTLGTFAFSYIDPQLGQFGNWLTFDRTMNDPVLGTIAIGRTENGRLAVAAFTPSRTSISIKVDSTTTLNDFYSMPIQFFGTRGGFGLAAYYPKTQTSFPTPTFIAHFSRVYESVPATATNAASPKSINDYSALIAKMRLLNASISSAEAKRILEAVQNAEGGRAPR